MAKNTRKTRKSRKIRFQPPEPAQDDNFYSEDDEDNICRCVCGDNDFTSKRPWVQCTACGVWQHNDCMDVSVFDDELGDHYWCEECDLDSHAALLEAVGRGERPWEGRCKERLDMKARFEQRIKAVMEQVEWLWGLYELQPRAVAGHEGFDPPRRMAAAHYFDAVRAAVEVLFEDLPMQSLRDLAQNLYSSDGMRGVMETMRKKAAAEYGGTDVNVLGILSELFEWVEKGKLYSFEPIDATLTAR
ncbi:hypothetical protein MBLNU13_g02603t1 [Cladosporium sp. NU13]